MIIPPRYLKWQSSKENGKFKEGQVNKINQMLGGSHGGIPWGAINTYLPDHPSQYESYKILSKYSEAKEGIEVTFNGDFSFAIRELVNQVVFKISNNDENVLIAEFWDKNRKDYDLGILPTNYKLMCWTMTRGTSNYLGADYESALVTMKWVWEGTIDDKEVRKESELQWTWHPYEPEK